MTNCRDDRDAAPRDRASHLRFVEGPQVLERASPATDDHHVNARFVGDPVQRSSDRAGGALSLDPRRADQHLHRWVPSRQHMQNVTDGRAIEGRHDSDPPRQDGQRALSGGIEQAFFFKRAFQLLEG